MSSKRRSSLSVSMPLPKNHHVKFAVPTPKSQDRLLPVNAERSVELSNETYVCICTNDQHNYGKRMQKAIAHVVEIQAPLPQVNITAVVIPIGNRACGSSSLFSFSNKNRSFHLESRALCYCQLHLYIHIAAFEDYYQNFFNGSNELGVSEHPAKLSVIFSDDYRRAFNVIRLMEFLKRAPTMKFDVYTVDAKGKVHEKDQEEALGIIFGPLCYHITTELAGKVDRVSFGRYYVHSRVITLLDIRINPDHSENWMANDKAGGERRWLGSHWNREIRVRGEDRHFCVLSSWKKRQDETRLWLDDAKVKDGLSGWSVIVQKSV